MSRRKRRKSGGSSIGLIIGGSVLLLISLGVIAAIGLLKIQANEVAQVDRDTLCPAAGPTSVTVLLLDVTDAIADVTALDLKNQFERAVRDVPVGGQIEVYTLTDQMGEPQLNFTGCNPGSGEQANEWISNPRMLQKRWETAFQRPLEQLSARLASGAEATQSPIMAAVQKINLVSLSGKGDGVGKTLIIASDMIEHTDQFSNYKSGTDFEAFQRSNARAKFRTSLAGVGVVLWQFQRPQQKLPTAELAEFWASWVKLNNGDFIKSILLEGME